MVENPHELLGLDALETDCGRIVEAARARLEVMRASTGSETYVRNFVISQIVKARETMLSRARQRCRSGESSTASRSNMLRIDSPDLN